MNIDSLTALCAALKDNGWSLDNVACFGMGGKLMQGVDRDTLKMAFKACAIMKDGQWHAVYKDPITDPGKTSKRGILSVVKNGDNYVTWERLDEEPVAGDCLELVFRNGELIGRNTLDDVRARVRA